LQAQQVSVIERQIATLEERIARYEELLEYQRLEELENAETYDRQRDKQLAQLEDDLAKAKRKLEDGIMLFNEGLISKNEFN
jgi:hypothetical protein